MPHTGQISIRRVGAQGAQSMRDCGLRSTALVILLRVSQEAPKGGFKFAGKLCDLEVADDFRSPRDRWRIG
jgi:hypothetical protein